METSNIIGESNVFLCRTEDPRWDADFVAQIIDYDRLVDIKKRYEVDNRTKPLSKIQMAITRTLRECAYSPKKDPCWGYIEGQGVRSRCLEGRCPKIKECNPEYTEEQTVFWTMSEEDRLLYGEPAKQKKYYLVDLVSEEEIKKYISDSKGVGIEFPLIKDKEKKAKPSKPKGRQKVIIGYEDTYFGDADNQLSPIWGYIDDPEEIVPLVTSKFGSRKEHMRKNAVKIEESMALKKHASKVENFKVDKQKKEDSITKVEIKSKVEQQKYDQLKDKKANTYQLTELTKEKLKDISGKTTTNIILANEAELAFVSSMLWEAMVPHDIELQNDSGLNLVCLWNAQNQKFTVNVGTILVSNGFLRKEDETSTKRVWDELAKVNAFHELVISGREFFDFKTENNIQRWGCRNLFGATHLVVRVEDLDLTANISCEQKIMLEKNVNNYLILSASTEKQLGTTTEQMWHSLNKLKDINEISDFPRVIKNLILVPSRSGIIIKGIGHMKFDEY